jgi:hypothetical protein
VDPLRAGVVERGVELREAGFELVASLGAVRDRLATFLLMGREASEVIPEVALRGTGFLQALFAVGDPALGGSDGVAVVASPVAAARVIESRPAVG